MHIENLKLRRKYSIIHRGCETVGYFQGIDYQVMQGESKSRQFAIFTRSRGGGDIVQILNAKQLLHSTSIRKLA